MRAERSGDPQQRRIAIVSAEYDLHSLIIKEALLNYRDVQCDIVDSDRIAGSAVLSWSNDDPPRARVPVKGGTTIDVRELDVIWWRRVGYPQRLDSDIVNPAHIDLINNDCRVALAGLLLSEFRGTWINHPLSTQLGANKLVQLRAAQRAGFRVPRTLVSQDPEVVRAFCEELGGAVVVKAVSGTSETALLTRMLTAEHLASPKSISLCPAIYQEYIAGECHLRVQCFGDVILAVQIRAHELDWRLNLNVPFDVFDVSDDIKQRLIAVLDDLQLKMGIVDLKLTPEGEIVWLEINPQGQFLFVEALTGLQLASAFATFLYREAGAARAARSLPVLA